MMSPQFLEALNDRQMNISSKTKQRIALVFATGAILVSAWSWLRDDSLPMRRVEPEGATWRNSTEYLPATTRHLRARKPAGEFFASQKEKRIQRLLANILAALPEKDQLLRSDYFVHQVELLADEDVPLVLQRLDDDLRHSEFGTLLVRRWTELSPKVAADWVHQLADGEGRDELMAQVAMVWSNLDINSASSWAQSLMKESDLTKVKLIVAEAVIRQDPSLALGLVSTLPAGPAKEQLTLRAVNEWTTYEPVAALRWVAGITDPVWQSRLRTAMVPVIASIDGNSGARLAVTWLPPGQEQERTAVAVVQRWAQQSPALAAEWVARFPAGSLRMAAMDNLERITRSNDAVLEKVSVGR
jgi:hypothetical protein